MTPENSMTFRKVDDPLADPAMRHVSTPLYASDGVER